MDPHAPTRARLRAIDLVAFADLRARPDLFVLQLGDATWLRWLPDPAVVCRLLALPEAEVFVRVGNTWVPAGRTLAVEGVPDDRHPGWKPLTAVVLPARIEPDLATPTTWGRVDLRLVPGDIPMPASAMSLSLVALRAWSDTVPESDLRRLQAVQREGEVFILGEPLPVLTEGCRYHGNRVLLPLGWCCEPALDEAALVEVLGLASGEIARITPDGIDVFAMSAFTPLTRVGLRRRTP